MSEYMYFDFSLFADRHHKVHSLKEFLFELSGGDPSEFAHVMLVIANDVAGQIEIQNRTTYKRILHISKGNR